MTVATAEQYDSRNSARLANGNVIHAWYIESRLGLGRPFNERERAWMVRQGPQLRARLLDAGIIRERLS